MIATYYLSNLEIIKLLSDDVIGVLQQFVDENQHDHSMIRRFNRICERLYENQ